MSAYKPSLQQSLAALAISLVPYWGVMSWDFWRRLAINTSPLPGLAPQCLPFSFSSWSFAPGAFWASHHRRNTNAYALACHSTAPTTAPDPHSGRGGTG